MHEDPKVVDYKELDSVIHKFTVPDCNDVLVVAVLRRNVTEGLPLVIERFAAQQITQ